jgi:hypothetical protein
MHSPLVTARQYRLAQTLRNVMQFPNFVAGTDSVKRTRADVAPWRRTSGISVAGMRKRGGFFLPARGEHALQMRQGRGGLIDKSE